MRQTVAGAHSEQDSRSTKKITILFFPKQSSPKKGKANKKSTP